MPNIAIQWFADDRLLEFWLAAFTTRCERGNRPYFPHYDLRRTPQIIMILMPEFLEGAIYSALEWW
jgi:hypothetical protein